METVFEEKPVTEGKGKAGHRQIEFRTIQQGPAKIQSIYDKLVAMK